MASLDIVFMMSSSFFMLRIWKPPGSVRSRRSFEFEEESSRVRLRMRRREVVELLSSIWSPSCRNGCTYGELLSWRSKWTMVGV